MDVTNRSPEIVSGGIRQVLQFTVGRIELLHLRAKVAIQVLNFIFGSLLFCAVAHRSEDEEPSRGAQGAEAYFQRKSRLIFSQTIERQSGFHHPRAWLPHVASSMIAMKNARLRGNKLLDTSSQELISFISEQLGRVRIQIYNFAGLANQEHGIRSRFENLINGNTLEALNGKRVFFSLCLIGGVRRLNWQRLTLLEGGRFPRSGDFANSFACRF
ncbi:MAG TPA: hypothetical protein VLX32_13265 [Candidatus Acidoferrum sp.]|nr:hypothetical protein [Candidatus Acidoferrum sp.]